MTDSGLKMLAIYL